MQKRLFFPLLPYAFRILDAAMICLAGLLAVHAKAALDVPIVAIGWDNYIGVVVVGAVLYVISWGDNYRSWRGSSILSVLKGTCLRWLVVVGVLLCGVFALKASEDISRLWLFAWVVIGILLLFVERLVVYLSLSFLRKIGYNHRRIAIIGSGKVATQLTDRIKRAVWSGYEVAEHVYKVDLAKLESLEKCGLDEIWLALPLADEKLIKETLHGLRHSSASIRFVPDLFSLRLINHSVVEIIGMPMMNLSASRLSGFSMWGKWLEDKILSSIILLMISPVLLALAIGVKLSSPGPVFYRQERVGLNNRKFMMLKFRSMPVDTEKLGVQWGGSASKATNKFGQFIRKTSLDELPQFINVLKGDMSIVGPRPERPMFVDEFKEQIPDYMKKHLVKAGITGWAQVNGWRGDTDLKERIEHDIYYIENWTLLLDLKIILLTLYKGFVHKNAY